MNNDNNAIFNLQLDTTQYKTALKEIEALQKATFDRMNKRQPKVVGGSNIVTQDGKLKVAKGDYTEFQTLNNLLKRCNTNLFNHIEQVKANTQAYRSNNKALPVNTDLLKTNSRSLRSFHTALDAVVLKLKTGQLQSIQASKEVAKITAPHPVVKSGFANWSNMVATGAVAHTLHGTADPLKQAHIGAQLNRQKNSIDNLRDKTSLLTQSREVDLQRRQVDLERARWEFAEKRRGAEVAHQKAIEKASKHAQTKKHLTPVSFGGIYATALGGYIATTPIRHDMSFERTATLAAKNMDYNVVQAFGGMPQAIEKLIFDAYKNPGNNISLFGVDPEKLADWTAYIIQSGTAPTLNKDGTVNQKSIQNVIDMAGLIALAMNTMDVDENTAKKFVSKAKNVFNYDYKKWKKTNPNTNESKFINLLISYFNDVARKNPLLAKDLFTSAMVSGGAASLAQMPITDTAPLQAWLLSMGVKTGASGTIAAKMIAGAYSHLASDKKAVAHVVDSARMKEIYYSDGLDGKDFFGRTGDAGALMYALSQVERNLREGKINKEEANKLYDYISRGKAGMQRSASSGVLSQKLDYFTDENLMRSRALELGIQVHGRENEEIKRMLEQTETERRARIYTLENMYNRMTMLGKVSSISIGRALGPSTMKFFDSVSKMLSGYSVEEALANADATGDAFKEWKGLIGFLQSETGKTITPIVMKIILGIVGLQIASVVKKFAMLYPTALKGLGGRAMNVAGLFGVTAAMLPFGNKNETRNPFLPGSGKKMGNFGKMAKLRKYAPAAIGGGLGLGLLYSSEIMEGIGNISATSGGLLSKIGQTSFGAGAKELDPTKMENMVAFWLLSSGNKALAIPAAIYLADKFFKGYQKSAYGDDYKEPAWQTIMRAAAIGVLMSPLAANPAMLLGAIAALGISFADHSQSGVEKRINRIGEVEESAKPGWQHIKDWWNKETTPSKARMDYIVNEMQKVDSFAALKNSLENIKNNKDSKNDIQNIIGLTVNIDKEGDVSVKSDDNDSIVKMTKNNPKNFTLPFTLPNFMNL